MKRKPESPWWMVETVEICATCNHGHAHRTEYYCIDCDRPICSICIERTVTLELVCPECLDGREVEIGVSK